MEVSGGEWRWVEGGRARGEQQVGGSFLGGWMVGASERRGGLTAMEGVRKNFGGSLIRKEKGAMVLIVHGCELVHGAVSCLR